jgi:uncharacterized membrane protein
MKIISPISYHTIRDNTYLIYSEENHSNKMNENIKAWLGLNLQDTLINISAFPFLALFFVDKLIHAILLIVVSFFLSLSGLIIYFLKSNNKISKTTSLINKWGSFVIVLFMWVVMLIRIFQLTN